MTKKHRRYEDGKYHFNSAANLLSTIISKYNDIGDHFNYLTNRSVELANEQNDLLHYIEFSKLGTIEGFKMYKKLKEVRIERRFVKNELESMTIAYDAIERLKPIMDNLQTTQGKCRKTEDTQQRRSYYPRTKVIEQEKFEKETNRYNQEIENVLIVK